MQGCKTFSNFSFTGDGFVAVTASAISAPILNASYLDFPDNKINKESVSPYMTRAFHLGVVSTNFIARSNVSLPLLTILSPT